MKEKLAQGGFEEIKEIEKWTLQPGKAYFYTRNKTTIIAFTLGNKVQEGVDLFKIIGCHTDSPVLKLAPVSKVENKFGFQQMNIQTYGGGLWRTWFDRDLGLAGRVIVKGEDGKMTSMLWDSKGAVMSIPSICIHLNRDPEFNPDKEKHLKPVMATHMIDQLMGQSLKDENNEDTYNV